MILVKTTGVDRELNPNVMIKDRQAALAVSVNLSAATSEEEQHIDLLQRESGSSSVSGDAYGRSSDGVGVKGQDRSHT